MQIQQHRVQVGAIHLQVREVGQGPAVLFCHGFPECGLSWRAQMLAVAQAGYRAIAPDQRGYGGSDVPEAVEDYSLLHLVGDMVGLLDALKVDQAVVVGHDWGAPVAWHCALLRPDRFRAVVALSVPFFPRGSTPPVASMPRTETHEFYQLYFQRPGQAEAELSRDVRATLLRAAWHMSGQGPQPDLAALTMVAKGKTWLAHHEVPAQAPAWLDLADFEVFVQSFERTGFTGALNWYRNLDRNWALMAAFQGRVVSVPAMYLIGDRDLLLGFPIMEWLLPRLKQWVPLLQHQERIPDCGHWIQREKAQEVNDRLLKFLATLDAI
ncbi:MAG: alpha/beta hydrolase [Betaproteobacteria bacterium]|jgi:pimeloyl-ACP methyl ester carboxylesterase|nr:alpha/beta hydrolase [Betaproteobacteria bacterium]NBP44785.1 alpha/beta hydrolase [Betaproteobacteria bacterium]